ncbi:alpha/beta fold hydrolase [Ramlibacter sp.]|uniref:alpha/beta fold hydrolase n=1 Tax=Ramlibacter sp. TaxID=1917967 RepID=UPI00261C9EE4|nr:alpha/beta fold hydrolase [Ramlibacter sp.]
METRACIDSPCRTGRLAVGGGHAIAWQEFGAAQGVPALVLHGGPGSALTPGLVRFFDLARWRVIGFDQRGCGASTPRGRIADNTTHHLLQDIEALRRSLGVARWCVVGGSWGATLALAYAGRHPHAVSGLLLRGLFVPDAQELRWFFHGARALAPHAWEDLAALAPPAAREHLLPWLTAVFDHGAPALQERVTLAWLAWEQALAGSSAPAPADLQPAIDRYRVQSHYLAHGCWLGDWALHAAARNLPRVPVRFLHGQADVVCRPAAARAVQALIPGSHFDLVPHAGHDPMHPAMSAAMQEALRSLSQRQEENA